MWSLLLWGSLSIKSWNNMVGSGDSLRRQKKTTFPARIVWKYWQFEVRLRRKKMTIEYFETIPFLILTLTWCVFEMVRLRTLNLTTFLHLLKLFPELANCYQFYLLRCIQYWIDINRSDKKNTFSDLWLFFIAHCIIVSTIKVEVWKKLE